MKVLNSAIIALVVFSQTGFASPAFDLLQQKLSARLAERGQSNHRASTCANFSGSWKGKCTVDNTSIEVNTEIKQQGCEWIQTGTETSAIGSVDSRSQTLPLGAARYFASGFTSTSDWSADGSQLKASFGGLARILGSEGTLPLNGTSVTRLDGGRLVNELNAVGMKISCVYDKQ